MNKIDETIKKLQLLKNLYRENSKKFLYREEFRDNGFFKKPFYIIEIHEYEKQIIEDFGNEKLFKVKDNLWMKHRTNLSSEFDSSNNQLLLSGVVISYRLQHIIDILKFGIIPPPGILPNGQHHKSLPLEKIKFRINIHDDEICCDIPIRKLSNARYLNSKITTNDVKSLQRILHLLSYDDEIEWDKHKDDGIFRTSLKTAVNVFVDEINYYDETRKRPLKFNNRKISRKIAKQLVLKCRQGWIRPKFRNS